MARGNPDHFAGSQQFSKMDQQSLRAILAQLEQMGTNIRRILDPATPAQSTPHIAVATSGGTQDQGGRVPSLTHSQTTDADSPIQPLSLESEPPRGVGLESPDTTKEKNLPSPAASDDVLPISENKTPSPSKEAGKNSQAPSAPDIDTVAHINGDDMPVTPADKVDDVDGSIDIKEPQSDQTAVEIDDSMDID